LPHWRTSKAKPWNKWLLLDDQSAGCFNIFFFALFLAIFHRPALTFSRHFDVYRTPKYHLIAVAVTIKSCSAMAHYHTERKGSGKSLRGTVGNDPAWTAP
jgi:hypothetical protein